jgi:hypothetical protein
MLRKSRSFRCSLRTRDSLELRIGLGTGKRKEALVLEGVLIALGFIPAQPPKRLSGPRPPSRVRFFLSFIDFFNILGPSAEGPPGDVILSV